MPSRSDNFWTAFRNPDAVARWNSASELARYGQISQLASGSILGASIRGGLSALLPIEAEPALVKSQSQIDAREKMIKLAKENPNLRYREVEQMYHGKMQKVGRGIKLSAWEKITTKGTRAATRSAGRVVGRVIGPLTVAYRLGTEVDFGAQGLAGGTAQAGRVIGQEVASTAGFMAVAKLGAMAGSAIGSFIAPGVGTAIGAGIGWLAGGLIGGEIGTRVADTVMGTVEAPFRAAAAGWKYFKEAGKRSTRMELGGGISAGNRSRIAYTMRSRALQQMSRSGINARSLLGMEAAYHHIR